MDTKHSHPTNVLEQVAVLKAIEPIRAEDVVLGQYLGSDDGTQPGYKDGEFILCVHRGVAQELSNDRPYNLFSLPQRKHEGGSATTWLDVGVAALHFWLCSPLNPFASPVVSLCLCRRGLCCCLHR